MTLLFSSLNGNLGYLEYSWELVSWRGCPDCHDSYPRVHLTLERIISEPICFCGGAVVGMYCFLRFLNLRTIKFTQLKCVIQRLLVYSHVYRNIVTNFRKFSSPQPETPYPSTLKPTPLTFSHWQPLILSLWNCIFWLFHINGII